MLYKKETKEEEKYKNGCNAYGCIYIYIYIENFIKQNTAEKNYILKLKNVVANNVNLFVVFFQNLICIERLMLRCNLTH